MSEADGDDAFTEIAPETRYRVSVLAGLGGVIAAISDTGAIALRDGDGWRTLAGESEGFVAAPIFARSTIRPAIGSWCGAVTPMVARKVSGHRSIHSAMDR